MSSPTPYISSTDVSNELGLTTDTNGNYLIWLIPTPPAVVDNFVSQANNWTTAMWGNLTTNQQLFPIAKMYAQKWAALRIVQQMAINWQVSGLRSQLGNIGIDRMNAMEKAMASAVTRLSEDLNQLYNMLADIQTTDAYKPNNVYEVTGGSAFWT